jgi:hypothetical protein
MYYKLIYILYALLCGQNFILVKSACYSFFSWTRSSEPMRNAAKGCGEGGVVCGTFYRVAGGEVRGRRRPAAVGFELVGFDIDSGRGVDGAPS